jgi:iron complex outermembrane receptor protein
VTLGTFQPSPAEPVFELVLASADDVHSERLDAYELGYRLETAARLSLDLAGFYNQYRGVAAPGQQSVGFSLTPMPHVVLQQSWVNVGDGHTYGAEASLQWQPRDVWRLTAGYSYIKMVLGDDFLEGGTPSQQASLRSYINLPRRLELNAAAYYVDHITAPLSAATARIAAYVRIDTGITWRASAGLELGVWGQNLLNRRHAENTSFQTTRVTEIPRTFLVRVNWRF